MPEGMAITAMTTLGYAGVLAGPALIGFAAHGWGLTAALMLVAAPCVRSPFLPAGCDWVTLSRAGEG